MFEHRQLQVSSDKSDSNNNDFNDVQRRELVIIIIEVFRDISISQQWSYSVNANNNESITSNVTISNQRSVVVKSTENIDYFDLTYDDSNNSFIVTVDKHVFYRDMYVFIDRLRDLIKEASKEQRIREIIFACLRDESLK